MSVDMRNSEGYLDLTAYEAIKKVDQEQRSGRAFRPIVYICSPYAGDIAGNVDAARRYSRFAVDKGYIPIAPHFLRAIKIRIRKSLVLALIHLARPEKRSVICEKRTSRKNYP